MITLKSVKINKYKSIEIEQSFDVDERVTTLVGKNESGKTAILEALAKSNYFDEADTNFKFNATYDYPRKEKKAFDKSGQDVQVITCIYTLSKDLLKTIQDDVGSEVYSGIEIGYSRKYLSNNGQFEGVKADIKQFWLYQLNQHNINDKDFSATIESVNTGDKLEGLIAATENEEQKGFLTAAKPYFANNWKWPNPIEEYIARKYIKPNLPKFLYYDEYYALPSEIEIKKLQQKTEQLPDDLKTSKALFDLADINIDELIKDADYEPYKAELEATSNIITHTLFSYWKTNTNIRVEFDIQKQVISSNPPQINPVLKIRVYNQKYQMSLPLGSRSKGFNWFFSFIVWFSKIQEDKKNNYVLLLDEPGLNLHAKAQEDLLLFIEDLSKDYQVIYTTHSPFMVNSGKLERVRTVLETDHGTQVSNSIQEKDPDTLFPLQAALGYDIAQNLFIGKNNLLIEGASDLLYLTILSSILEKKGKIGLKSDITLVPVGGLDKVTSFISLLRGQKLNIACLLDTFTDQKGKKRMQDLIQEKIIKEKNIRFFDEFASIDGDEADLEDMFSKGEFLKLFNQAFSEHPDIAIADLDNKTDRIILQINNALKIKRFNHYRPGNELARLGADDAYFEEATLQRFEVMFKEINKLF